MMYDIERHARTRLAENVPAPGGPGEDPHWTSGAKSAVGTAVEEESRVWFTLAKGILTELYFPSIDQANSRKFHFVVTNGDDFFSNEETDTDTTIETPESGIPAFSVVSRCRHGRYEIRKYILTDPARDVLLLRVELRSLKDEALRLFVVFDPHVQDSGADNLAWLGTYKSIPMLFAKRDNTCIALASSIGFNDATCGYRGTLDPLEDLRQNKQLTVHYGEATKGNVVLAAEVDQSAAAVPFVLALGFGGHGAEAGQQARAGLLQDFEKVREQYVESWKQKQSTFHSQYSYTNGMLLDMYRISTAVLQIHESKRCPGAMVASLSIPWGNDRGDEDISGYHVIWPRDMVQCAMGKVACGDVTAARRTLFYLRMTQEADGNWPQNMWLDGTPNWNATQMDGTSYSVLLADTLRRSQDLGNNDPWDMVCKAARFLLKHGPYTEQERWEENEGYSPNTMAVEIAALLAAADFADERNETTKAEFFRSTADAWNDCIEELTYATGTALAKQHGVEGYYVRIAPPEVMATGLQHDTPLKLKNLPDDQSHRRAVDIIGPDFLALVRFGLRAADDPRIVNTVKVVDATLKKEVSTGPVWYRYTADGYGEKPDGSAFGKTGQGRGWPLLAGERAHYEVARGEYDIAASLLATMAAQTSPCGLIPEQIWDAEDIPEHDLYNGHPTGSGMPLVWAHAEFIKLLRSLKEKRVWDMPPQPVERYQKQKRTADFQIWTFTQQRAFLQHGKKLRIDSLAKGTIRWTVNSWQDAQETTTTDSQLGIQYVVLPVHQLEAGAHIEFTVFWPDANKWEGRNFTIKVV